MKYNSISKIKDNFYINDRTTMGLIDTQTEHSTANVINKIQSINLLLIILINLCAYILYFTQ